MKPEISSKIIFRAPKFSWKSSLAACWSELKQDISISSPAFYAIIRDVEVNELDHLPPKTYFTIWKYFNRARFRATPFGTFGGFGIAEIKKGSTQPYLVVSNKMKIHSFVNWPHKNDLVLPVADQLSSNPQLFTNTTYYVTSESIRFVTTNDKEFELAEVALDQDVINILEAAVKPVTMSALMAQLATGDAHKAHIRQLLVDMVELKLLFTDREPNIIGQDYFERLKVTVADDPTPYLIAEMALLSGNVEADVFRYVPSLIDLLQRNVSRPISQPLAQFVSKFRKKFEQAEVPIMLALDPEMGIGYDELEQAGKTSEFASQFLGRSADKENSPKKFRDLLTEKLEHAPDTALILDLNDLMDMHSAELSPLPNSMSAIGQVIDDRVYLEHIGGATSNALNGRFTLASDEVLKLSNAQAADEAAANPGVTFFDVAYMGEANVDNINRRKAVYEQQISILNFDLSESPISLSDVFVSVQGDEVVLRHSKTNERLVPRLATAYNYSRSDLSLFRLMCDLQHQSIHAYLLPDLEKIMPGRNFYPRLIYRNLILAAAKWHVKTDTLPSSAAKIPLFLAAIGVPQMFRCGVSDQLLCFDQARPDDMIAFHTYAAKFKELFVEEVFFPDRSAVVNESGDPLVSQFILNVKHGEAIYPAPGSSGSLSKHQVKARFMPGSEWLYFEIYCHQQRADMLLDGPIRALTGEVEELINKWFFIRYDENGDHLRLRFNLKDAGNTQSIITRFNEQMDDAVQSGYISDVQIKTYKRELARYGEALIEDVETHFWMDSILVLEQLGPGTPEAIKYQYAVDLAQDILRENFSDEAALNVARSISDSFAREHRLDASDFKKLNQRYQEFRGERVEINIHAAPFKTSFSDLLGKAGTRSANLFSDLFHMHVNRLFPDLQRTHEMIIYYLVVKEMLRKKATVGN